jgi:hypothetical protein
MSTCRDHIVNPRQLHVPARSLSYTGMYTCLPYEQHRLLTGNTQHVVLHSANHPHLDFTSHYYHHKPGGALPVFARHVTRSSYKVATTLASVLEPRLQRCINIPSTLRDSRSSLGTSSGPGCYCSIIVETAWHVCRSCTA